MHEPIRIELDDPALAASLCRALSGYHAEVVQADGRAEVRVDLVVGNPERHVTQALHAIDRWLARTGTASVTVHLDGQAYTLAAPPPA